MTVSNSGSGAPSDHQSGAPVEDGRESSTDNGDSRDPGKERLLKDLHKFKAQAKEFEAKYSSLEQKFKAIESENLRKNEDWKTAYEKTQEELKALAEKHTGFLKGTINDKKREAVKVAALKAGIQNEADIDFFPIEEVHCEFTTEGRFIVDGHEAIVEAQKKVRPYLFKSQGAPTFNAGGGRNAEASEKKMTGADLHAIEVKHGRDSKEWKAGLEQLRKTLIKK